MKILIKVKNKKITIPVPISMCTTALKLLPQKYITKEQKLISVESLKIIKKELKKYKGMKIFEVEVASGEHISITI